MRGGQAFRHPWHPEETENKQQSIVGHSGQPRLVAGGFDRPDRGSSNGVSKAVHTEAALAETGRDREGY